MSLSTISTTFLEHLQGQWLNQLPGQSIAVTDHTPGEVFHNVQPKSLLAKLEPFPLVLLLVTWEKSPTPTSPQPPFRYCWYIHVHIVFQFWRKEYVITRVLFPSLCIWESTALVFACSEVTDIYSVTDINTFQMSMKESIVFTVNIVSRLIVF